MYALTARLDDRCTRYDEGHIRVRKQEHEELMRNNPAPGDVIDHYWEWDVLENGTEVSTDAG